MAGDPDPAYPPEFEALDVAFARALNVAEGDAMLARKLWRITTQMNSVASAVDTKAQYDAERGVE